jgi:glycosyltransferase involved in cell wall biosynthesis
MNEPRISLTVGIPTYNRRDRVVRLVEALCEEIQHLDQISILVSDDGSTDGTTEALEQLSTEHSRIVVRRSENNLGYGPNLVRLFQYCQSSHVVIAADDDEPVPGGLARLLCALTNQTDVASLLVSRWCVRSGRVVRGQVNKRSVTSRELSLSANHAPGLVYQLDQTTADGVRSLRDLLDAGQECALVWPQKVLVAQHIAAGTACWYPDSVFGEGLAMPSGLRGAGGREIESLTSQWESFITLDRYLMAQAAKGGSAAHVFEEIAAAELPRLYAMLRKAMGLERPEVLAAFDATARRHIPRKFVKDMTLGWRRREATEKLRSRRFPEQAT